MAKLGGDCDDADGSTSPATSWYRDNDSDGYGDLATSVVQCLSPDGYLRDSTDCNDTDASVYPGAAEICDGIYNNCLDSGYNAFAAPASETDDDTDGYVECTIDASGWDGPEGLLGGDCNDESSSISPSTVWFLDADGDGYGKSGTTQTGCLQPDSYVAQAGDCADGYASVFPGAPEICDGLRNDCSVDNWALYEVTGGELDQDNDGFVTVSYTHLTLPTICSV